MSSGRKVQEVSKRPHRHEGYYREAEMSEYMRTGTYQFCDTELVMILDTVTGEPQRFGPGHNSIDSLQEALKFIANHKKGWESRTVIVRLQCIKGFKLEKQT